LGEEGKPRATSGGNERGDKWNGRRKIPSDEPPLKSPVSTELMRTRILKNVQALEILR